ncbi:MAG: GNAT family N-acetyltransferase [Lachnospiraceae bacterium]|nr:GNAT family N-acetyltransferase [Lachnospiraceae bacterium]
MPVKINTLSEEEIRSIGDAFADYEYADSEWGMSFLGKGKQAVSDYICAYVRMAIKERVLYSTSDKHEAFIAFKRSEHKMNISSAAGLMRSVFGCIDYRNAGKAAKGFMQSDKGYGDILLKLKIPHIYVGMVAVTKKYQGQGYMRKLMEIAFEEGRKHSLPVVLDTDAELKKSKYEHLSMKCVTTTKLADGVKLYGMVYEPENIPKEWRSDVVMDDYRILKGENESIWDKFSSVYSAFVTGTPANKKAYEVIYKRIRTVVKDKEVLEIATGPGMIAKQVADEAKSMTATDFSEKMLAVARRGEVPSNLKFEQADACKLPYDDNSFDVVIIANALHVIPEPEKALAEIRRVIRKDGILIAPNFIHDNKNKISGVFSKALSAAGVVFKAKWDAVGFTAFLEQNGFAVRNSKQLNSTIPMVYTEAVGRR